MIAVVSFALLVALALAYVLAPLVVPGRRAARVCRGCARAMEENENYCIACGRPAEGR